jgi:hypothetical protein
MTDLEITKACAEAMGLLGGDTGYALLGRMENHPYDPLHDDGQAMALVRKFHLSLDWHGDDGWTAMNSGDGVIRAHNLNISYAICECVANIQAEKLSTRTPA